MFRFSNAIIFFRLWQRYHDRKGGGGGDTQILDNSTVTDYVFIVFVWVSYKKKKTVLL